MNARQKAKYYKRIVESTKVTPVIICKNSLKEYQVKTQCSFPPTTYYDFPEDVESTLLNNLMCELEKVVRECMTMTADEHFIDNRKTVRAKFRFWIRETYKEGE